MVICLLLKRWYKRIHNLPCCYNQLHQPQMAEIMCDYHLIKKSSWTQPTTTGCWNLLKPLYKNTNEKAQWILHYRRKRWVSRRKKKKKLWSLPWEPGSWLGMLELGKRSTPQLTQNVQTHPLKEMLGRLLWDAMMPRTNPPLPSTSFGWFVSGLDLHGAVLEGGQPCKDCQKLNWVAEKNWGLQLVL